MKKTLNKKKSAKVQNTHNHSFIVRWIAVAVAIIMLLAMFLPLFIGGIA